MSFRWGADVRSVLASFRGVVLLTSRITIWRYRLGRPAAQQRAAHPKESHRPEILFAKEI